MRDIPRPEQVAFLEANQRFLVIASEYRQFRHYVTALGLGGKTCVYLATDEPESLQKCRGRDPKQWAVLRVGEYTRGRVFFDLIEELEHNRFVVHAPDDRNGFYR